jgi:23S rRNA (cytosine1962-C5)-methyltransferase
MNSYTLIDCGNRQKLEQIGQYIFIRPAPQALWPAVNPQAWQNFDLRFDRQKGEKGSWIEQGDREVPWEFQIKDQDIVWNIQRNNFGNVGVFTEHWLYADSLVEFFDPQEQVLNLFAYSGSSCMKLLKSGFKVTAVDSSKQAMNLYTENLESNRIDREGQRLILEDALSFCRREIRRGNLYSNILVDAPSYGRGKKNEVFDIDESFLELLEIAKQLLKPEGQMVLTYHSPRYTPETMNIILKQVYKTREVTVQELLNPCKSGIDLPSGVLCTIGKMN